MPSLYSLLTHLCLMRLCQPGGFCGFCQPQGLLKSMPAHSRYFLHAYQVNELPPAKTENRNRKLQAKVSGRRFSESQCWATEPTEVCFWNVLVHAFLSSGTSLAPQAHLVPPPSGLPPRQPGANPGGWGGWEGCLPAVESHSQPRRRRVPVEFS